MSTNLINRSGLRQLLHCLLAAFILTQCSACVHDVPVNASLTFQKSAPPVGVRPVATSSVFTTGQKVANKQIARASAASKAATAEKRLIAQVRKRPIETKHYNIEYWDYQCQGLIVLTKSAGGLPVEKAESLAKSYLMKKGLNVQAMIKAKRLVFDIYCPD